MTGTVKHPVCGGHSTPTAVNTDNLSKEKRQQDQLSPANLALICQTLSEVGYVGFEKILPINLMEEVHVTFEANFQQNWDFWLGLAINSRTATTNLPVSSNVVNLTLPLTRFDPKTNNKGVADRD